MGWGRAPKKLCLACILFSKWNIPHPPSQPIKKRKKKTGMQIEEKNQKEKGKIFLLTGLE